MSRKKRANNQNQEFEHENFVLTISSFCISRIASSNNAFASFSSLWPDTLRSGSVYHLLCFRFNLMVALSSAHRIKQLARIFGAGFVEIHRAMLLICFCQFNCMLFVIPSKRKTEGIPNPLLSIQKVSST